MLEISLKQEEINEWIQRINDALLDHKKKLADESEKVKNYYKGEHWNNVSLPASSSFIKITDNRVFSNIRAELPRLYYRRPKVIVKHSNYTLASLLLPFANKLFKNLKCTQAIRNIILDTALSNFGVAKLGYHSEFGYDFKVETDVVTGETIPQQSQQQGYNEYIKEEYPFLIRISPQNIILDPMSIPPYEDAIFIIHVIVRPYFDVKNDAMYSDTQDLPESYVDENSPDKLKEMTVKSSIFRTCVLYEVHYKKRVNGDLNYYILTIPKGSSKPIRHVKSEYDFFPFEFLYFNTTPDETYSFSDAQQYLPLQDNLNILESAIITHILRVLPKIGVVKGSIADEDLKKLTSAYIDAVVSINDPDAIKPIQFPNLALDVYNGLNMTKGNINEVGGVSSNQRGMSAGGGATATEMGIIQSNLDLRSSDRLEQVSDFIIRNIDKTLKIAFQFFDSNKYIDLLGDENGNILYQFVIDKKIKDYETTIDLTSMIKQDDNVKIKLASDRYNLLRRDPLLNPKLVIEDYLKATKELNTDFRDPEDYFMPEAVSPDKEHLIIINMTLAGSMPNVQVQPNENLQEHLKAHIEFSNTPLALQIPPLAQQFLQQHIQETQQMLMEQQQQPVGVGGNTIQRTQGFPEGNKLARNVQSINLTSNE